jgi:hypothetical protein
LNTNGVVSTSGERRYPRFTIGFRHSPAGDDTAAAGFASSATAVCNVGINAKTAAQIARFMPGR